MKNKKKIYKVGLFEIDDKYFYKGVIKKIGDIAVYKNILGVCEISTDTFIRVIPRNYVIDSEVYYPIKNNDVTRDLFVFRDEINKHHIMGIEEISDYLENNSFKFTNIINDRKEREKVYELSRGSKK